MLAGISDIVGSGVPVIGGSSADAGKLDASWWVASASKGRVDVGNDCVAVTALWPSVSCTTSFLACIIHILQA